MMKSYLNYLFLCLLLSGASSSFLRAENGYRLWLRYDKIADTLLLEKYCNLINQVVLEGSSPTINAVRREMAMGLSGLLGRQIDFADKPLPGNILIAATPKSSAMVASFKIDKKQMESLGNEGFYIFNTKTSKFKAIVITANTDIGILYGTFHFLQLLQTGKDISNINIISTPKIRYRLLNHWDNLNRTVERGYAGFSLWQWHTLPDYIDQRYIDYARANASIGINGTVLTNVNANADILTPEYLAKVAALANAFRPYGLRVYLTARFSAPIEIGGLKTADPLDPGVIEWWKNKADEIYSCIPDFGGFLVKANSEGQPGPQNYNRSHAEGANLLARAVKPYGGIVMWRAFVYSNEEPEDRAKQAYNEFKPLDGKFEDNVIIQVKNGPIDFQPREPFHPLFGAMTSTPVMMEFQVTQEYLGQGIHLTYLAPLYTECLDADTYAKGQGSFVRKVIDGSLYNDTLSAIAGVSNIGNDINWTGHPVAQSNWFALGRLAWNPRETPEEIADEWIRMTYLNDEVVVAVMKQIMMISRDAGVSYRTPLGLHHQMAWHHHYGPGPWIKDKPRADWTSVYYNRADRNGIGFDRTKTGSNAVSQYFPPLDSIFGSLQLCPEEYLLWFHHVPWDYRMKSGRTLWEELCHKYYEGVDQVRDMQKSWEALKGRIDDERFTHVQSLLKIQLHDATEWRNACVLYFQNYSGMPIPEGLEKPDETLEYYMKKERKYLPGS